MDRNTPYFNQVSLLVRILPIVAHEECFALKGGTAINLFVRDLPRLSVDIDLGMSLPMVSKLLGHTQIQTTARYAHLASDPIKEAANLVADSIAKSISG